jgi:hypothetical protein
MKKFSDFMEPEGSLLYPQEPATGPYPKPDKSNPHPAAPYFPKIHFNIILQSTPRSLPFRLTVRDQVSQPNKTTDKFIFLY